MIQFSIKTEKILLLTILGLVLFNFFARQCSRLSTSETPKITITKDTVWQIKTDTFKLQTVRYKTVYVHEDDVKNVVDNVETLQNPSEYNKAKVYQDTLSNDDIDIYSYNLLNGNLLDSKVSYKLKVPREITITKTIEQPKTYKRGLYVFSEVGGNKNTLDNLSLGIQYNRKGNWFASYRLNLNQLQQPTHNIGVGVRVFK